MREVKFRVVQSNGADFTASHQERESVVSASSYAIEFLLRHPFTNVPPESLSLFD
jgi:hypothetical protein